jgi:hypothetical protein
LLHITPQPDAAEIRIQEKSMFELLQMMVVFFSSESAPHEPIVIIVD